MGNYTDNIRMKIEQVPCNEIFVARELKKQQLSDIPEAIYYKALERMVKAGPLMHLAKGLYYRPCMEGACATPISNQSIVDYYISDNGGIQVGEGLLIEKGLISGTNTRIQLLSNRLVEDRKQVGDVHVQRVDFAINLDTAGTVQTLEILQNYSKVSGIDSRRFVSYMRQAVKGYSDEVAEYVLKNRKYKKSTIAFYKEMLDWFEVPNCLDEYLSSLSQYKIPTIEQLRLDIPTDIQINLEQYVEGIRKIYGKMLWEVILYGSYAKGNYDVTDSDIDIMILLDGQEDEVKMHRHDLSDWTYDFNEEHQLDIKPIAKMHQEFTKWEKEYPFYRSIRKDGVKLYGVA